MTKTEFKAQNVEERKVALLDLFEDPGGEIAGGTSKVLNAFIDENWDYIDSQLNPQEPEEVVDAEEEEEPNLEEEEGSEESPADDEEVEPEVLEPEEEDLSQPNPRTSLHTGTIPGPSDGPLVIHQG